MKGLHEIQKKNFVGASREDFLKLAIARLRLTKRKTRVSKKLNLFRFRRLFESSKNYYKVSSEGKLNFATTKNKAFHSLTLSHYLMHSGFLLSV